MAIRNLTEQHYEAIRMTLEGRTNVDIARELGVHRNTVSNWTKDPTFAREVKRTVVANSYPRLTEVVDAIVDSAVKDRNAASQKLVLQMNDMLTDKVDVVQTNVTELPDKDELIARVRRYAQSKDAPDV